MHKRRCVKDLWRGVWAGDNHESSSRDAIGMVGLLVQRAGKTPLGAADRNFAVVRSRSDAEKSSCCADKCLQLADKLNFAAPPGLGLSQAHDWPARNSARWDAPTSNFRAMRGSTASAKL
jgi:hypothetical protein